MISCTTANVDEPLGIHTSMTSPGRISMCLCALTLLKIRPHMIPTPVIKSVRLRPLIIATRSSASKQHGIDAGRATQAFCCPDSVLSPIGVEHGLGEAGALDLQRIAHPEVLAQQWHPRHQVVLDVPFFQDKYGDIGIFGQSRCEAASRCPTYHIVACQHGAASEALTRNPPPTMI